MSKYKIAWLPGDGIGKEVMEATRIVLDKVKLDAGYIHGDIGWEFWCKEGDALPQRTVELLRNVRCRNVRCDYVEACERPPRLSWYPNSGAKGSSTAPRSCGCDRCSTFTTACGRAKAYPGNPLNFKEGIDLVVFRENTEDLYAGVEFAPGSRGAFRRALKSLQAVRRIQESSRRSIRNLLQDQHKEELGTNRPRGVSSSHRNINRKKVTIVHKANVVRATDGLFLEEAKEGREGLPANPGGRREH